MATQRINFSITTNASGAATKRFIAKGELLGIAYDGGLDNSADITISDVATGAVIAVTTAGAGGGAASSSRLVASSATVTTSQGVSRASSLGDTGLTQVDANSFMLPPLVFGETLVTVANGGNALTGVFVLLVRS